MVKPLENVEEELRKMAIDSGACDFAFIKPSKVVTAHWVRLRCQFGCKNYNTRYTCPPYSPTPEATRSVLDEYVRAYLIKYEGFLGFDVYPPKSLNVTMDRLSLHVCKAALDIERHAFLSGYYKAFSYGAHRCRKCDVCSLAEQKGCRFPVEARPSMESAGIDVFQTAQNAGLETHVLESKDVLTPKDMPTFTLLLLE